MKFSIVVVLLVALATPNIQAISQRIGLIAGIKGQLDTLIKPDSVVNGLISYIIPALNLIREQGECIGFNREINTIVSKLIPTIRLDQYIILIHSPMSLSMSKLFVSAPLLATYDNNQVQLAAQLLYNRKLLDDCLKTIINTTIDQANNITASPVATGDVAVANVTAGAGTVGVGAAVGADAGTVAVGAEVVAAVP